jgi:exopolysaccharide production protein ExoQ
VNPVAGALRRIDVSDRKVQAVAAAAGLVLVGLWLAVGIGTAQYDRVAIVFALLLAPFAIVLALRRPMLFPYALYVIMIPFDNMLSLGKAGTLTKFLALAAVAAIAVNIVRTRRFVMPGPAFWLWCAFWLLAALGVTWTPDPVVGWQFLQSFGQIILLYGILAIAPLNERDLRMILTCIVVGGALAAIYGIVLFHDTLGAANESGRLYVNVDNRAIDSNHFANALLAPLAISLVALLRARNPAVILATLVAVLLFGAAIVMTLSREAMAACVLIVFVIVAFSKRRLLATAVAVPALGLIPLLIPSVAGRIQSAVVEHGGGRNYIWHVVMLAWQQHPWLGWGTGGAIAGYNANYLRVYATVTEYWGRPPHNTYLHAAVELGVVGLILFCAALFATFADLKRVPRTHPLYDVRVMLTASLVALFVVAMFIDLADYKYLWIVIATAAQFRLVVLRPAAQPP